MGNDSLLDSACERSIQIDGNNSNHRKKLMQYPEKKLLVTAILRDSIVNDVKDWELSDKKNKVVVKPFSGAKSRDMRSYITLLFPPSNKILKQLSFTLRSNHKKRETKNIYLIDHRNISPK